MKKCEPVTAKADETKMKALAVFQGAKREAAALKSIVTIRMKYFRVSLVSIKSLFFVRKSRR